MLKNYLNIAIRNLLKHKSYSFINIIGLAVGIACCIIILIFVQDELSYENFHDRADRIYRTTMKAKFGGQAAHLLVTPSIVGPMLQREFPEIEKNVRIYNRTKFGTLTVRAGDKLIEEKRFFYADSTLFSIFSYPLIYGDPAAALTRPNTIVLTQSTAEKYFGDINPVGQSITVNNATTYQVTGVMTDIPRNSHLQFDLVASYTSLRNNWAKNESWFSANLFTYIMLGEGTSIEPLQEKVPALIDREIDSNFKASGNSLAFQFMPVKRIHLHSQLEGEANGDILYVYIFSIIAVLILLIACVNYMNLATARSAKRAQEVGMRKILGALRKQLAGQFFGESLLMTALAMVFGIILVHLSLPYFNTLAGKQLTADYFQNPFMIPALFLICILVSFIAGSYPALFLSAFQPLKVMKGGRAGSPRSAFRNRLVIFQFAVSIILIIATVVINSQLDFFRNKKLGFDKEQILVLNIGDNTLRQDYPALKKQLLQHSAVQSISAASGYPGNVLGGYTLAAEGMEESDYPSVVGLTVDTDFLSTTGIEQISGRPLPPSYTPEQGYLYLINEAALNRLGWEKEEAVGKWVNLLGGRKGELFGVVKNFHFASLHSNIEPLALFVSPKPYDYDYLLVKLNTSEISNTLGFISETWEKMVSHRPFEYSFVDREFEALYRAEERLSQIFMIFTGLAVFIACLGLLGLISYTAEQRTKEIGIRKVLGASIPGIVVLLSKDFLKLVLVAIVVAIPIAWWMMNTWLQEFAYRVNIGATTFLLSGGAAILLALLTISYQSIKAALSNPAKSIRYE